MKKKNSALVDLLEIMARLRSPRGCPWDREQDHRSIRSHAVEEAYELMDAIENGDDQEMAIDSAGMKLAKPRIPRSPAGRPHRFP